MGDPLEGEPRRAPTWATLEKAMHLWLVVRFGLNRPVDKDIWLFCIGTSMELERLAMGRGCGAGWRGGAGAGQMAEDGLHGAGVLHGGDNAQPAHTDRRGRRGRTRGA